MSLDESLKELSKISNLTYNFAVLLAKADGIKKGFQFYVSYDLKTDITHYAGVKVNYVEDMPSNTIIYGKY